jgi:urease accessory protein
VQTAGALLHGDSIEMRVELGEDARVEITDIAAMVAHDGRGGPHATLQTTARLAPGAVFVWDAKPLVLCAGCAVRRTIALELAAGATALLRDTIVLGRPGQPPGVLKTCTTVRYAGVALHHETLDTSDTDVLRSPAVLHDRRVLDTVAIYGARCQGPGVMQLDGPGSILVIPASEAADAGAIATTTFKDWQPDAQAGPMR